MGAQPEKAIVEFVKKISGLNKNGPNIEEMVNEGNNKLKEENFIDANEIFKNILNLDAVNIGGNAGYIRSLIGLEKLNIAEEFIKKLDESLLSNQEIKASVSALSLILNTDIDKSQIKLLNEKVQNNPNDLQSNFDLSIALFGINKKEEAINLLLKSISINPEWKENSARKKLLEYFTAIGLSDPLVINSRKKLSSIIFK